MGYPARDPLLLRSAIEPWPRKAGFFKSLDYGNIARMAGMLGLGYLAFKSVKLLVSGKAAPLMGKTGAKFRRFLAMTVSGAERSQQEAGDAS